MVRIAPLTVLRQPIPFELRVQQLTVDIEGPCRFGAIAWAALEGAADEHLLQAGHGGGQIFFRPRPQA